MQEEVEYDFAEAARVLSMNIWTLRRLVRQRQIGHYRKGVGRGVVRFLPRHLEQYKQSRMVDPVAA